MASTSDLFLRAFASGGNEPENRKEEAKQFSPDERARAFQAAFGQEQPKAMPKANKGIGSWRLNMNKKLDFAEAMELQSFLDNGTPYSELPARYLDEPGLIIPSAEQKQLSKEQNKIDGFSDSERRVAFDAVRLSVEALADMTEREVLRDTPALDYEFNRIVAKHGESVVAEIMQEYNPEAAGYFTKRAQILATEKKQADALEMVSNQEAAIRAEIRAAKEAIEAENAAKGREVAELTTEQLQAELTRRLNTADRLATEMQEDA